ncbi:transcriptional regulator [Dinoroseobacter shibae DFL 12 = DSM 16493]|uniref:Transcriptional regulator n=1 Tax=Dinoroseobacter shibae (strain DSM 16493 / NCIMB 14021 / DFL 12) TaxID=398580 RepID=A8LMC7_DINSH|nr:transcriptional regulator [Dinoroseobacter shibae DFL 12 = DSM 16493]
MPIENWDEVRTAFQVARLGTVSGAAEVLGVHHATVIRHIDSLEGRLGVKLFQRHARGYTATDAGKDLLQVAQVTADQLEQLSGRLHGHGAQVTGELVITSLEILSPLIAPVLAEFQREHRDVMVKLITDARVFRLEYGEAHVAIRAGRKPEDPDNIVQPLYIQKMAFFGTPEYLDTHGPIEIGGDYAGHRIVGSTLDEPRAPFNIWMQENMPAERVVYRASDIRGAGDAVVAGVGAGLLPVWWADKYPGVVRLCDPIDAWSSRIWLITHVDLHRTAKVQSFTGSLKAAAKAWP